MAVLRCGRSGAPEGQWSSRLPATKRSRSRCRSPSTGWTRSRRCSASRAGGRPGSRVGVVIAHGATGDMSERADRGPAPRADRAALLLAALQLPVRRGGQAQARPDCRCCAARCARRSARSAAIPPRRPRISSSAAWASAARWPPTLASARVRVDGLFLMAYPLHRRASPRSCRPSSCSGSCRPRCSCRATATPPATSRRCARRSCAWARRPMLRVVDEADRQFKVLKKSGARPRRRCSEQMTSALDEWIQKHPREARA